MAIYHKWKCVFVHIPKTAGTSIHSKLYNRTDYEDNHKTFFELLNEHDAELFESYWSFSVVRNPYDRFISAFEYAKTVVSEIDPNSDFNEFIKKIESNSSSFYSYLPIYFMPQHKFITIKNITLVDEIIRFENLKEEWKNLANKLNDFKVKRHSSVGAISYGNVHTKLDVINVTPSRLNKSIDHYFVNKDSKNIIYELYKKDFELFDYEK